MKALDAKQLLIAILILCGITAGIALVGFWQYRVISSERQQRAQEANVEVSL